MNAWVRKEAVIAATKSRAVVGWAQRYYRWMPCSLQDSATGAEELVHVKLVNPLGGGYGLSVPARWVKVQPRHLGMSIPLVLLGDWNRIRESSEREEEWEARMVTFKVWMPPEGRRVWKHIHIQESETLDVLATAIIEAYHLDGDPTHLYQFYFTEKPWEREGVKFVHPAAEGMKANKIRVAHLNFSLGETFNFLYDFGDEWHFKVKVEKL